MSHSNNLTKTLGIALKQARLSRGYSLRKAGQLANITPRTVCNVESGAYGGTYKTLSKLLDVYQYTFELTLKPY